MSYSVIRLSKVLCKRKDAFFREEIENAPTIDVAPMEEVERLQDEADRYKRYYFNHCFDELRANVEADVRAETVRKMAEKFSSILEKEYRENTPEGADYYFKNGALMMWSIADRVFAQIAKEMLEDST